MANLTRRFEVMELEKVKAVKTLEVCSLGTNSSHRTQDCLIMLVLQENGSD